MLKIFRKILGIKYLLNTASGEVHRLKNVNLACGIDKMSKKNKKYLTERQYQDLINIDSKLSDRVINGCVHCFKETDTD